MISTSPQHNTISPTDPLLVYLVEDDDDLREDMVLLLRNAGFFSRGMPDAATFYEAHAQQPCDVAVLDIGLHGSEDGLSIAANLRERSTVGIVMASARASVECRIDALRRGADVFMVKPVHIDELVATTRMLGSRVRAAAAVPAQPAAASAVAHAPVAAGSASGAQKWYLVEGGWILCDAKGRRLKLTTTERAFVARLFHAGAQPVRREDLLAALSGAATADGSQDDPRRLDVIASRLRRKAADLGMPLPLHALRGMGYQFIRDLAG